MRVRGLILVLLLASGGVWAEDGNKTDFSELTQMLRQELAPVLPGGFTVVLRQGGEEIYRYTLGRVGPGERVAAASASKWYAAAAVLALVDEGRLSLDDEAGQYLTKFSGAQAKATVGQMLSHTSGIEGGEGCIGTKAITLGECVDLMAGRAVRFEPGTAFAYGAASINAAGRIAEIVTGKSWDWVFQEKIASPLEFGCTTFGGSAAASYATLAGGVETCAEDYAKFVEMIAGRGVYRGRRVLSARAVAEMQRPRTAGLPVKETPYSPFFRGEPALMEWSYGAGEWVERRSGMEALEVSSQGALSFSPWVDVERGVGGVLAAQDAWSATVPAYLRMKELIRRLMPAPALGPLGLRNGASDEAAAAVPGMFVNLRGARLGPAREAAAEPGAMARELAGTRVLVDGEPAALVTASERLVRAVLPESFAGAVSVRLTVQRDGVTVAELTVPVDAAWPGLVRGAVENEDGTWNNPQNPARPGSVIALYGTGLNGTVEIRVGGRAAEVLETGPAPGWAAGLQRVVARVPAETEWGAAVSVEARAGRGRSQAGVTLAVGERVEPVLPVLPR